MENVRYTSDPGIISDDISILRRDSSDSAIFIMAAGSAIRTGGYPKQLFTLDGEPIIRKTIRLIHEVHPEIPIYIVTWREELRFSDCDYIDTKTATPSLAYSFLLTEHYWKQFNYFFLGDVVYTSQVMKEILFTKHLSIFGSYSEIKKRSERYALVFNKNEKDRVLEVLHNVGKVDVGGLGYIAAGFHKKTNIIRSMWKSPQILRDIYWKLFQNKNDWIVPGISQIVENPEITNFDTFPEYWEYCLLFSYQPSAVGISEPLSSSIMEVQPKIIMREKEVVPTS